MNQVYRVPDSIHGQSVMKYQMGDAIGVVLSLRMVPYTRGVAGIQLGRSKLL
jgi:hypothetical protein